MLIFNERKYRDELKASLGFQDIPDDELYDHNMVLNSPLGAANSLSLSVGKFIDADVETAREAYMELNNTFDDVVIPSLAEPVDNQIILTNKTTFNGDNIKYYDVDIPIVGDEPNIRPYTVAIYVNPASVESLETAQTQIRGVTSHFTFVGERNSNELTGMEFIITYYQFVNLVGALINKTDRQDVSASIAEKIAMEFEGDLALEDIKKQFGFN